MLVGEGLGEVGRRAEVIAEHVVVGPLVDTAVRQDGDRQGVGVVRVRVQERVGRPDGGRAHRSVGLRLVGTVQDVVLLGGLGVLGRRDGAELQFGDDLVLDFALDADVLDVQVDVVVGQLVLDVERGVVPGVVLVRIQGAGGVQCVGVRVDVEVTLDLAVHRVYFAGQGSRGALAAEGRVGDHVHRQVPEDLVGGVQVRRVALDGALQGPARIVHQGQGGVVVGFLAATGGGDGMVVLHAVREQQAEPVRIAVFRGAQVGGAGLGRVLEAELAGGGVVLADQLVHLAVDTAVHGVRRLRVVQVTLLLELLVDGHLVLGVHDVEGGVHRLQADGVFARVADVALARLTLLGRDHDNARHRARTID